MEELHHCHSSCSLLNNLLDPIFRNPKLTVGRPFSHPHTRKYKLIFSPSHLKLTMKQISFPPEVLARISPEISLQRHLALGIRPNLRNFTEFKPVSVSSSTSIKGNNIIASAVIKSGNTTIINNLSVALHEINSTGESLPGYGTIYPIVEIQRGRIGEPTDEEMHLAQTLHETIYHSKLIPLASLDVALGVQVGENEIIYDQDEESDLFKAHKKQYQYVLQSQIQVLSRSGSTSALFDLIYESTLQVLKDARLPRIYLEDIPLILMGNRVTTKNKRGFVALETKIRIDTNADVQFPLLLTKNVGKSSNFGVINVKESGETVLLADLEGDAEETGVVSRISVIATSDGRLKKVSLVNGDGNLGLEQLQQAIEIARLRAQKE